MKRLLLAACVFALGGAACPAEGLAQAQDRPVQTGFAAHAMVAAANPHAVEAGLEVLRAGGSAADAAVAVQAALGLVEPQSSGLGGGAFMLYYDARTHAVTAYDGREVAPMGAKPDMFLGPDHKPMPFRQAMVSGKATGVPGAVAMLALAQREHGRLPWKALFDGPERLARDGFQVTPRLADDIVGSAPEAKTDDAKAYFFKPDGQPYRVGDLLKNPAYADMLKDLADKGGAYLYGVEVGQAVSDKVSLPPDPGVFALSDMASYQPHEAAALCRPYRAYVICAPPPPAGGVGVLEIMGELAHTDIASRGPTDPQAWYEFAEASRLAYADRDHYIGDPAFVPNPVQGLLDPAYEARRAAMIATLGGGPVSYGQPAGALPEPPDATKERGGTSDFAIVDDQGNVVSMTTTVNLIFGTGRMVRGFFLNDQLNDFDESPTGPDGLRSVNAVAPGKRPRSSMSPVIVLDRQGRFVGALGSPGGSSIIAYVAKSLVAWLDWHMPLEQAFALPNMVAKGDSVSIETGEPAAVVDALQARGLKVKANVGEESGLSGIAAAPGGLSGAADPRREGIARGY
jgi:gamma-glutamyltranspeptidase / glutathione hydrolase